MKRMIAVALGIALMLTGCYDARELDERDFVQLVGLDWSEKGYQVTLAIGDAAGDLFLRHGEGENLVAALADPDTRQSKTVDYGHTRTLVLGQGLMAQRESWQQAAEVFLRDGTFSLKTYVTASPGSAREVLEAVAAGNTGDIYSFYENNQGDWETTFPVYLKDWEKAMTGGESLVLPLAQAGEDGVMLAGAAAAGKDGLLGYLTAEETAGLTWCGKRGGGRVLSSSVGAVRITGRQCTAEETQDGWIFRIQAEGQVEEAQERNFADPLAERSFLTAMETELTDQVQQGLTALQNLGMEEVKGKKIEIKIDLRFTSTGMAVSPEGYTAYEVRKE
ncbi:MAG TPA: hypothetical protein H9687_07845 [Firmicutes bacterium]|nr:hypothetical protein [Bacillota bacterium]